MACFAVRWRLMDMKRRNEWRALSVNYEHHCAADDGKNGTLEFLQYLRARRRWASYLSTLRTPLPGYIAVGKCMIEG